MIRHSVGIVRDSTFLIKSEVSLMYVCCSVTNGCRKKSTYSEILSTGQLLADIIGLAFVGGSEWTLLSKYNLAVFFFVPIRGDRYLRFFSVISLLLRSCSSVS